MAENTEVAFCFVGQFIRHATITRDVRRFGASRYHAFVASSLQHSEERAGDNVVDSATLCGQLRTGVVRRWQRCLSQSEGGIRTADLL